MSDRGVSDDRAEALLKEAAVTEEQQRAAGVTLAGLSLAAHDGDQRAAAGTLRDALSAIGVIPYEPPKLPKTSRMRPVVSYARPGR
jgi:hypothetical protein